MAHDKHIKHGANNYTAAKRILLVLGLMGGGVVLFARYGHLLQLNHLVQHEAALRSWGDAHIGLALGGAFVGYTLATGFSLPGAAIMTLVLGWFFGFARAFVVVSFASTAGATLAFLISRFLLRDWVQSKFQDRLTRFNDALKREGAFYLFTLRLIPVVPFFRDQFGHGINSIAGSDVLVGEPGGDAARYRCICLRWLAVSQFAGAS
jgi:uncharacterized membrane protein YdjX (TVP38/TMEM64 family)